MRPIRIDGDVAFVPLTKGYESVIDASDAGLVDSWCWHSALKFGGDGSLMCVRARRFVRGVRADGKKKTIWLHRFIIDAPDGLEVDHIDGDTLNNRRRNLRLATTSQNAMNRGIKRDNSSGHKGVNWVKKLGKWQARISAGGTRVSLGFYDDKESAALAYAEASKKVHGEFGRLK